MRSPFVRSVLFAACLAAGLGTASLALACKCRPLSPQEAHSDAQAVFEGRVSKIAKEPEGGEGPPPGRLITLSIVRTWKGLENEEVITLRTSESSASCGFDFELDTSYLVYATGTPDALNVTTCSRTRLLSEAGDDLALLGAGNTPVKITPPDAGTEPRADASSDAGSEPPKVRQGGCASSRGGHASLLWLGPVVGLVLRRRRRHGDT